MVQRQLILLAILAGLLGMTASSQVVLKGTATLNGKGTLTLPFGTLPSGNTFTFVQATGVIGSQNLILPTAPAAGNLVVAEFKWEGTGNLSGATNGSTQFVFGTEKTHSLGEPSSRTAYLLAAPGGQTLIFCSFTNGTPTAIRIQMAEFSATGTHAFVSEATPGSGTSTSLLSGSASSSTANGVAVAFYAGYTGGAISSTQIGGTAATGSYQDVSDTCIFWLLHSSTLSAATATATVPNNRWNGHLMLFNSN